MIKTITELSLELGYIISLIAALTLPIWGYKLLEANLGLKHKALKIDPEFKNTQTQTTQIVASLGTTTAGVFLIQILPLIFSIINDVGADYNIATMYGDHFQQSATSEYVDSFYGLTAQLSEMLQTAAPMAAVGLGGYNLMNNLGRGLPALIQEIDD